MKRRKPPSRSLQKGRNGSCQGKTLGPVFNLEEHVDPDWWCRLFNSLYLKTDADVVDDARITRTEAELISNILTLSPEHRILDLCCGQGRHTLELARRGLRHVEGLDRSHYLIQKAKERAKSESLSVKFREGDARKLPYPADSFDAVLILGNSFGYFETLQDDLRVLKEVMRVLKPWGKVLIDIADGDYLKEHFQARSWEWIDDKLFVCRERSLSLDEDRLVSREVVTHVERGVIADQFYAERLYTTDTLSKLLSEAGFSNVSFPAQLSPDSQRAQDLGMMEKRIVTTAQVKKAWAPMKQKPREIERRVAVVMGDPNKADPLKPLQVFDDDDFYTIDQMKAALRELNGYSFTYLNNHDTLIQDLTRLSGKIDFVFNLCDEGYSNNPLKELHVPAILETLGIPYTGAGPQCLVYCYDKSLVRGIAREMGLPVPNAAFVNPEDSTFELPFDFPAIVKPNFGDSSFGITVRSIAYNAEELLDAIREIRQKFGYDKPMLVEEFLTGKDLSVGIIGTPPTSYTVLPITEEDYSAVPPELPRICGYEAKWCPDSPYWNIKSIPADLPNETRKAIVEWCVKLSERLECRDYTRFDWRLDSQGTPKLLEVNPNPGWCWDGHLAKMAGHAGISYSKMLETILRSAEERLSAELEERGRSRKEPEKPAVEIKALAGMRR
ncbi:MAG: methyltransferase domain-containing protein [Candidatus Abyssobacteria bacterium SURF_17]|uniref:Methyltransferase domain-containing protein n=1 Tax=Candidatus Abyssobacteria bacterium SURF_17 TaxID=2093361 RepID=A0A419EPG8_9BACT|nr:MAG: methyltransferase domain-containing protein [Candidatus Abyssubacteria bacterium SURF_17]